MGRKDQEVCMCVYKGGGGFLETRMEEIKKKRERKKEK
jgi:hypothetical protein